MSNFPLVVPKHCSISKLFAIFAKEKFADKEAVFVISFIMRPPFFLSCQAWT